MVGLLPDTVVKHPALGRTAFIGELYDCRTDTLSSMSVLNSSFPSTSIQKTEQGKLDMNYKVTENLNDRFELLEVGGELQLSVLSGLINVAGSGKYLTECETSEKTVSCSFVCKVGTVSEKVLFSDENIQHLNMSALENPKFTHVVSQIDWGSTCILELQRKYRSNDEKKRIEANFQAEFKRFGFVLSPEGKGDFKPEKSELNNSDDINIKIEADVKPTSGWPTTVDGFFKFLKDIPNLIINMNEGKGKPLNYVLIPLSYLRESANLNIKLNSIYNTIEESFLITLINSFEEIYLYRKKLNYIYSYLNENKNYVTKQEINKARKHLEELKIKESKFRNITSENLVKIRSGEDKIMVIRAIDKFRIQELNFLGIDDFVDSFVEIERRLERIDASKSLGIFYLEVNGSIKDILLQATPKDVFVLVVFPKTSETNSDFYTNIYHYFISLIEESNANSKYVIADLNLLCKDLESNENENYKFFISNGVKNTECCHFSQGKLLSSAMYAEYLEKLEMSVVKCNPEMLELCDQKPIKRVPVEITCPGFYQNLCPPAEREWFCHSCESVIDYGFDSYFYCLCGKAKAEFFSFRCKYPKHGSDFFPFTKNNISTELSKLRPFKELNILVLGQSGVGKSTWINSVVNYLSYQNLDEARNSGVIYSIPVNLTIYDNALNQQNVRVGDESRDEVLVTGSSATQEANTYSFIWEKTYVKIIDTPGLGDTMGIKKDKENMKKIIDHISYKSEIHGVCILMKASDSKLNVVFKYTLKELLVHLHKSITKNMIFCFTNSRNSFYRPGSTLAVTQLLLEELKIDKELTLGPYNTFCLDNEAFLYLCALKNKTIHFDEHLYESFCKSWEISAKETVRLFTTVKNFKPHLLKETLSLVTARNRILSLSKPIADITKIIQINLNGLAKKQNEINDSNLAISDMTKLLYFNTTYLESVELNYPRTVCTNSKCVTYITSSNSSVTDIEYSTHCHDRCYIDNVEPKTTNNAKLYHCQPMKNGICTHCGCGWEKHMHITFSQKRMERQEINKKVKEDIDKTTSDIEKRQTFVEELKEKTKTYENELKKIIQISIKMATFLKQNAITVYNDSILEYLEYSILEEENKPYKTEADKELLIELKKTMDLYKAEVDILKQAVSNCEDETKEKITENDICKLENELYSLKLTGEQIRRSAEASRSSSARMTIYTERPLPVNSHRNKKSINPEIPQKSGNGIMRKVQKTAKEIGNFFISHI